MKYSIMILMLLFVANNSNAVTAEEYMASLANEERITYVIASAEMAISIYLNIGDKDKATCIRDWLQDQPDEVMENMNRYLSNPDNAKYPAAGVIRLIFEQQCAIDLNQDK